MMLRTRDREKQKQLMKKRGISLKNKLVYNILERLYAIAYSHMCLRLPGGDTYRLVIYNWISGSIFLGADIRHLRQNYVGILNS